MGQLELLFLVNLKAVSQSEREVDWLGRSCNHRQLNIWDIWVGGPCSRIDHKTKRFLVGHNHIIGNMTNPGILNVHLLNLYPDPHQWILILSCTTKKVFFAKGLTIGKNVDI